MFLHETVQSLCPVVGIQRGSGTKITLQQKWGHRTPPRALGLSVPQGTPGLSRLRGEHSPDSGKSQTEPRPAGSKSQRGNPGSFHGDPGQAGWVTPGVRSRGPAMDPDGSRRIPQGVERGWLTPARPGGSRCRLGAAPAPPWVCCTWGTRSAPPATSPGTCGQEGGNAHSRREFPAPAPLCQPHSLSVEGVLARQHPQLLLHPKILQADGAGLLWEVRRRLRAGANGWDPPEMPRLGKSPVSPAGSSAQFPNHPRGGGFWGSHPQPVPALLLSTGDVSRGLSLLIPAPSRSRGGPAHPVHVQPAGIAFQNHLRERRRGGFNSRKDLAPGGAEGSLGGFGQGVPSQRFGTSSLGPRCVPAHPKPPRLVRGHPRRYLLVPEALALRLLPQLAGDRERKAP